ncbi:SGNH/GDSL hydrolase family protein [Asticcacaulis sp. AC402]|uniref:SGNH/GDSL hydrolase family protein n=1 Tax=Asticcacaulis sp. AC402 TaxID=1282361 RepID=UPI0003C3FA1C|nr:SGNH/GDSL hydrolase family protein [Asticcacaulis sp. AC402]ESQ73596.1 hydrolase GDSL [Asticcacaulis sp. AC402]
MSFLRSVALTLAVACISLPATAETTKWIPAWYAAPQPDSGDAKLTDMTLRQIVRVSAGGTSVRLRLSNAYGKTPLNLDEVRVARRDAGSRIDTASDRPVTFNGQTNVMIAPGAYAVSDPIDLDVADNSDLAVSLYAAGPVPLTTLHDIQRAVMFTAPGRQTSAADIPGPAADLGIGAAFPWLAGVDVSGGKSRATAIAFGDSITDGYGIDRDKGATWPDVFSRRLDEASIPLSVVNAAISGNRIWHHGQWARFGEAGLARFDRDVLAQPNAAAVIVLIGINDLGHSDGPGKDQYVSGQEIIAGLRQMADRAHSKGLRIYVATLTPFKATVFKGYYNDAKEAERLAVNTWIRQQTVFDGVFDFDKTVEDPSRPGYLLPAFDVSDHLHPDTEGVAALANAIPLDVFTWAKQLKR